jgi:Collagenase and related proteases
LKIIVSVNNKTEVDNYKKMGAYAFIFGLQNFSTMENTYTLEEIQKLSTDIEIFVNINKMIFNTELEELKHTLIELSNINIKGILFYDLAILELVKELKLDIDLVWFNTHMVTNYNTCNYYFEKGVKYAIISSEITLEEIIEIKNKSNITPMVQLIMHPVMAHSRRKLLTNFYKENNVSYDKKTHVITNKDVECLIKENEHGTIILNNQIQNGSTVIKELLDNNFSYIIISDENINEEIFQKITFLLSKLINNYDESTLKEIEGLIGNDTGFFFKKTIYKVK